MVYFARPRVGGKPHQELKEHLLSVGAMASQFAAAIGLDAEQARWAGLLHDLGKYSDEFHVGRLGPAILR